MKRNRIFSPLCLWVTAVVLAGCSTTPRVAVDFDPNYNFSAVKTYALVDYTQDDAAGEPGTTLVEQRIAEAIQRNMSTRGIKAVDQGQADLVVSFTVVTKDKTRINTYNTNYGFYGYRRGFPYGYGTEVDVRNYTEGTLIIDLVQPGEKRIVWRGASSAVLRDRSPEERRELIDSHVNAIMAEMPLRQGGSGS